MPQPKTDKPISPLHAMAEQKAAEINAAMLRMLERSDELIADRVKLLQACLQLLALHVLIVKVETDQ